MATQHAVSSTVIDEYIDRGAYIPSPPMCCSWRACKTSPFLSRKCLDNKTHATGVVTRRRYSRFLQPIAAKGRHYLVTKVSGDELNKLLSADRESSVVVGFYATWCGPCITLAQELEWLALEFEKDVKFVKVDTDEEYDLANKMQVRGLPTVLFVSKDVEKNVIRTEGILPREVFRQIIVQNL